MKKLMIFYPESKLCPKGGAAGYLYNLNQYLKDNPSNNVEISFLQDYKKNSLEERTVLRKCVPVRLKDIRRVIKYSHFIKRRLPVYEKALSYDILHFHSTEDMYLNRDLLDLYRGKVILTSHSPCVFYKEIIGRLNPIDYKWFKKKIDRLEVMDIYAFNRADYIVFPCKEAEEPYFNTWQKYDSIRKDEKYYYLPTGIVGCTAKYSRNDIREKYGIPQDAFVISYVGRHNEIKGFGDLKKIGGDLLQDKNIFFLIAGKEGPMIGLINDHWIEVGWTNDPYSLIAASDVFMLPNHETYFDLILLEVISLGVPVVMSETGGNKYFRQFCAEGIKFYQNLSQAKAAILAYKNMERDKRVVAGQGLIELFSEQFTIKKFTHRYLEIIREIGNKNNSQHL